MSPFFSAVSWIFKELTGCMGFSTWTLNGYCRFFGRISHAFKKKHSPPHFFLTHHTHMICLEPPFCLTPQEVGEKKKEPYPKTFLYLGGLQKKTRQWCRELFKLWSSFKMVWNPRWRSLGWFFHGGWWWLVLGREGKERAIWGSWWLWKNPYE